MIKFRDYQKEIIDKSLSILLKHRFVYLAMEVRTGKTFTSLGIAQALFLKNVLFITKKKAIGSIEKDYQDLAPKFKLIVAALLLDVIAVESSIIPSENVTTPFASAVTALLAAVVPSVVTSR